MNRRHLPLIATILVFILVYALCAAQYPKMLSFRVVGNLLTDNAFLGIVAVGMTFVIISGGIDLSVGAVIAFTTVFLAIAIGSWGVPPLVAFALIIAIAVLFGAAMGAVIHFLKTPPFIVTLAGMLYFRGISFDTYRTGRWSPSVNQPDRRTLKRWNGISLVGGVVLVGVLVSPVDSPEVALSRPATSDSRVDLPHPDAPTMQTNSPRPTSRVTRSSATTGAVAPANTFDTSWSRSAARGGG